MNMPTDKWKVHLQQLVLSEMSASAVPQFNAEAEYRNGLYTANIFFHTKKTMIVYVPAKGGYSFLLGVIKVLHICQWPYMNKLFESTILKICY